jgi:hypothetical protein
MGNDQIKPIVQENITNESEVDMENYEEVSREQVNV